MMSRHVLRSTSNPLHHEPTSLDERKENAADEGGRKATGGGASYEEIPRIILLPDGYQGAVSGGAEPSPDAEQDSAPVRSSTQLGSRR